ncbi:DUF6930 domain-containing protein [Cellulosilyticum sp. I15G10I2]|uniref:DUF6930 domain-containing protein n=1 Tax=Cellulosilyticum sp. I15G10I2 TaxID=1892843 RepID=UPI00085CD7C2|nr:hypothetical protein [Cellulosilyticum sp. I15G10I2]
MSGQLYYEELSKPFIFNNDLLCGTIKAMAPTFSGGECILSVLPSSFKCNIKSGNFSPSILYMLATSMTCCILIDGTTLTDAYDTPSEYLQELLTHFGTNLVAKQVKPQTILVDTPYIYHLLNNFCEKCGIDLSVVKELKYAPYFISVALFEEGASEAVVEALGGDLIEDEDYFETPEEFSSLYYPKFMESTFAKDFSRSQLLKIKPYIELFSKMMWEDADEIPYDWSEDSLKQIGALILHGDLNLRPDEAHDFLQVLTSFLKFLDTVLGFDISTDLLPVVNELSAE